MKADIPDRVNIRKSDRLIYERLFKNDSPFAKKEAKELFIMAMILGFCNGTKVELDTKEGYVRIEYFSDEQKSIIKAIAVAESGNLNILLKKKEVFSIAEKYAAGGIALLKDEVFNTYGNYSKRLESDLLDEYNKLEINISEK